MRNYLIDYARARPNAQIVSLEAMPFEGFGAVIKSDPDSLLNLNRLLDELAIQDSEACSIVELKYFLGLSDEETAEILGVNVRTLQRHWQDARRWLYVRLRGAEERDQKS
jgi:DNA-directed RNA polymerase specialized sigma24 family protein